MNLDFSRVNLEYLIQARDLAMDDPVRAGAFLGISDAMTNLLLDLTPHLLTNISRIDHPLVRPHQDVWWWSRLVVALQGGQPEEIEMVLGQASPALSAAMDKRIR